MVKKALYLLLFCTSSLHASINLNQLKTLFDAGEIQQAYDYAAAEVTKYEGDPNFDYYYGISAIDTGHASQGVFALERVLLSQPNNHAARLELARGYFILEEYTRARTEFQAVLDAEPPEDVSEKIVGYLDAIRLREGRYTTTQNAYVEIGFGSDSNVNSGPDINSYTIGTLTIPLDIATQQQDDVFSELSLNYGVNTPISISTSYYLTLNANLRNNNDHSEFNTATYALNTGFQLRHAQDAYNIELITQQFNLDTNKYRQLIGLNANWRRHLSQQSTLQTYIQFLQQDFDGQETRDAETISLGISFSHKINATLAPVIFSSLNLAQDTPKMDSIIGQQNTERDYRGLRLGIILNTSAKTSAQFSLSYQSSEYALADTLTGIIREDEYLNGAIDFTWLINRNWSLFAKANITQNNSNNLLYEYDRKLLSLNLRYTMK